MTVRSFVASVAGQLTAAGLRLVGRQGTALPGLVATTLDPDFLRSVGRSIPNVLVSGTNGKTTTTTLLMQLLAASGRAVILNGEGSNLARGIASTLLTAPSMSSAVGTFEVDEAELVSVARALEPEFILLLNLFRDQMDRYGELDATARKWQALGELSETIPILNVDDPNLGWLATKLRRAITFGIESVVGERRGHQIELPHTADAVVSPVSGQRLRYRRLSFSHLGDYRDPASRFRRPPLDFALTDVRLRGLAGSRFRIKDRTGRIVLTLTTPLPGLFNVYNVGAAAIAALAAGADRPTIETTVSRFHGAFGRFDTLPLPHSGRLITLLVKNPVGFDQALSLVAAIKGVRQLVIGINDRLADGTDVSWLWDVDFESLADPVRHSSEVKRAIHTSEVGRNRTINILTTGTRAHELANRLHYAGINPARIATDPDLTTVLRQIERTKRGTTVCCLTYTALLEFRRLLARRGLLAHQFAEAKKSQFRKDK